MRPSRCRRANSWSKRARIWERLGPPPLKPGSPWHGYERSGIGRPHSRAKAKLATVATTSKPVPKPRETPSERHHHGHADRPQRQEVAAATDEARHSRHDFRFLFSRSRGDRARLLQTRGPRRLARTDFPGRQGLRGAARRRGGFPSAAPRIPRSPRSPNGTESSCSAQGQGMYWFLVMHADFKAKRGDVSVSEARALVRRPGLIWDLRGLLAASGIDLVRDQRENRPRARGDGRGQ